MHLTLVWTIPIDAPSSTVWRYIADTNRLNQYAGLPEFTFQYIPEQDGGSRQVGETRYLGWRLRWDEHPFEWVEGRYYAGGGEWFPRLIEAIETMPAR
jgi:hypothetical protein